MFRQDCSHHLLTTILPFWENLTDWERGGWFGYVNHDLFVERGAHKGCILNSRILWTFSTAARVTGDKSLLRYARHAFAFLPHFEDTERGGVYWSVTADGEPLDKTKHTYCQAFAIYATLASFGFFDKEELKTLNRLGTKLPSHCNMLLTPGVDMTAGSLGQGISCGVGLAIGSKLRNDGAKIYVIVGDGECQEGQVWEAAMLAAHKKLDNLVVLVDNNKMQIDGLTENVCGIEDVASKFDAFGFNTVRVNGNDEEEIDRALCEADNVKGRPTCIVMDTVKGEGVSIFKNMGFANHSCNVSAEQLETALAELED